MMRLPALLLFCLFACSVGGEDAGLRLTLQQAFDYAIAHNLQLQTLQQERAIGRAGVLISKQRNNPRLVAEFQRADPRYFVGAGYLFETGNKRRNRIHVAEEEAALTSLDFESALRSLRHDIRVSFYKIVQAREKLNEISASRNLAESLQKISEERYESGDVAKFEVLQADLELKRKQNETKLAESDYKEVQIQLNLLLSRAASESVAAEGTLEGRSEPTPYETLLKTAQAEHPEIKRVNQEIRTEEARLALAKSGRYPDLDVEAGTEFHDPDVDQNLRTTLNLELPILNRQSGEIARSQSTLERLRLQRSLILQKVEGDVREAYYRYSSQIYRIQNYRDEILPAAAEIEQLAKESYHEGKTGILSALEAQRSMHEVRLEYLEALLELQAVLADLEQAAGANFP